MMIGKKYIPIKLCGMGCSDLKCKENAKDRDEICTVAGWNDGAFCNGITLYGICE